MQHSIIKFLLIFIIIITITHSSSCILDKINTNIVVFGNYDENIGKLDIEAKLTYVNIDTGDKKPIPGAVIEIVVNVTKNNDESYLIPKEVVTNGMGWGKKTFYLEKDIKEYQVKVYYKGDGTFKEAMGTLGGGGEYEQASYTTNLPEGISLTACLPFLVLIGFLGAAMYASGGNPFGFVDMSTSRGFRMNRNLRKTLFVQGLGGFFAATGVSVAQAAISAIAGNKTKSKSTGDGKSSSKNKEEVPETGKEPAQKGKVPLAHDVRGGWNFNKNKREIPNLNKSNAQKVTLEGKNDNLFKNIFKGRTNESTPSKALRITAAVVFILGAMFTGRTNLRQFLKAYDMNVETIRNRNKKNEKIKNTNLKEHKEELNKNTKKIEKGLEKVRGKIEKTKNDIETLQKGKENVKGLKNRKDYQKQIDNAKNGLKRLEKERDSLKTDGVKNKKQIESVNKLISVLKTKGIDENISIKDLEKMKLNINKELEEVNKGKIDESIKQIFEVLEKGEYTSVLLNSSYTIEKEKIEENIKTQKEKVDKIKDKESEEYINEKEKLEKLSYENEILDRNYNRNFYDTDGTISYLINSEDKEKALNEINELYSEMETKKENDKIFLEKYNKIAKEEEKEKIKNAIKIAENYEEQIIYQLVIESYVKIKYGMGDENDLKLIEQNGGMDAVGYANDVIDAKREVNNYYNEQINNIKEQMNNIGVSETRKKELEIIKKELEKEKIESISIVNNSLNVKEHEYNLESYKRQSADNGIYLKVITEEDNVKYLNKYGETRKQNDSLEITKEIINTHNYDEKYDGRLKYEREEYDRNQKEYDKILSETLHEKILKDKYKKVEDSIKAFDSAIEYNKDIDYMKSGEKIINNIENEKKKIDEEINTIETKWSKYSSLDVRGSEKTKDLEKRKKELMEDEKNIKTIVQEKVAEEFLSNKNVKEIVEKKFEYKESKLVKNLSLFGDDEQKKEIEMTKKQEEFFAKKKKPKKPEDE